MFAVASMAVFLVAIDSTGVGFAMMFFAMFFFLMGVWRYTLPQAGLAVSPGPLLAVGGSTPDYLGTWLPGLLMTGTAVGLVLPSLSGAAVTHLPPARFGVGSAVNQAVRQIGSVLGVALTVAFVGHANPQIADFRGLYLTHLALGLLAAILCLRIDTAPQKR